jgi:hypothetical protein
MDHLEAPLEPVLCHLWKWHAPLLVSDSSIMELLHLFDLGQSPNPSWARHLSWCLEAEMP